VSLFQSEDSALQNQKRMPPQTTMCRSRMF
jgi:hypothetical protein